ncbi:unnamed protein product [Sphagnum jensenii]|uniref:WH1 domain-containing protein n=1 Tax=Sphagnum jensenii TaxID=128206 RepID=A0ABP0VBL8_9BRYO
MLYDDNTKKWLPSAHRVFVSSPYLSTPAKQYIPSGRQKTTGPRSLKYNQATPTFHQWRDNRQVYGLNFSGKEEADAFAMTMIKVVDILNQNTSNNMITTKLPPNSQPLYGHIGTPEDYGDMRSGGGGGGVWQQNNDIMIGNNSK